MKTYKHPPKERIEIDLPDNPDEIPTYVTGCDDNMPRQLPTMKRVIYERVEFDVSSLFERYRFLNKCLMLDSKTSTYVKSTKDQGGLWHDQKTIFLLNVDQLFAFRCGMLQNPPSRLYVYDPNPAEAKAKIELAEDCADNLIILPEREEDMTNPLYDTDYFLWVKVLMIKGEIK
ncbi:MAG: hypothetical protein GY861_01275 [bacterium]|nr:hypothetical protein [bacterium]